MSAECPTCHKNFRTRRKLKKHYQRVHRETLPSSRGIFGVEGVKGKKVIEEKQKYQSALTFADNAKRQVALGNVVTFGDTSEQFSNLQQAINEVSKVATRERHGIVLLTADNYGSGTHAVLPSYVDLASPRGLARIGEVYTTNSGADPDTPAVNSLLGISPTQIHLLHHSSELTLTDCFVVDYILNWQTAGTVGALLKLRDSEIGASGIYQGDSDAKMEIEAAGCYFDGLIDIAGGELILKATRSRFLYGIQHCINNPGLTIYLDSCVLGTSGGNPLELFEPASGPNLVYISNSLICGFVICTDGTVEFWSCFDRLENAYGAGIHENLAVYHIDSDFRSDIAPTSVL